VNLCDVNILVYAFRKDGERHAEYRQWLLDVVNGEAAYAVSEQVLAGFVRIVTHPRIFKVPSTLREALDFVDAVSESPRCRVVQPSPNHWSVFVRLCESSKARGNLVSDAWHAALAIDSGCVWITSDRDFARFPGLRWRHPLDHDHPVENPSP